MIESLIAQRERGLVATADLAAARTMMQLITEWDAMPYPVKLTEAAKGNESRFREVPGFQPSWCGGCQAEVFLDYREDPEGACGECGTLADVAMPAAA